MIQYFLKANNKVLETSVLELQNKNQLLVENEMLLEEKINIFSTDNSTDISANRREAKEI